MRTIFTFTKNALSNIYIYKAVYNGKINIDVLPILRFAQTNLNKWKHTTQMDELWERKTITFNTTSYANRKKDNRDLDGGFNPFEKY